MGYQNIVLAAWCPSGAALLSQHECALLQGGNHPDMTWLVARTPTTNQPTTSDIVVAIKLHSFNNNRDRTEQAAIWLVTFIYCNLRFPWNMYSKERNITSGHCHQNIARNHYITTFPHSVVAQWTPGAQLVKTLSCWPWGYGHAVTISWAAIDYPTAYNLQHHQRPVTLIPCGSGVGG